MSSLAKKCARRARDFRYSVSVFLAQAYICSLMGEGILNDPKQLLIVSVKIALVMPAYQIDTMQPL